MLDSDLKTPGVWRWPPFAGLSDRKVHWFPSEWGWSACGGFAPGAVAPDSGMEWGESDEDCPECVAHYLKESVHV